MKKQNTIQIVVENYSIIDIHTEREITPVLMNRIKTQLNAMVNDTIYHDIYGRLTSINMTIYMLEQQSPIESRKQINLLKAQMENLSGMLEQMTG